MKISLPIFFPKKNMSALSELGIQTNFEEDNETRMFTFYEINGVVDYYTDEKTYSTVLANGDSFVCALSKKEVEALVDHELRMDSL